MNTFNRRRQSFQTETAKEAYNDQLDRLREQMSKIQQMYDDLTGDGTYKIEPNWNHVGDVGHLNSLLERIINECRPVTLTNQPKRKTKKTVRK